MRTSSRDVVCIVFDEFELFDLAAYSQVLSLSGKHWNWRPFRLHIASTSSQVRSTTMLTVQATCELPECPPAEILFVPGGYGARVAMRDPLVRDFLRTQIVRAEQVVSVAQGSLLVGATGAAAGATLALVGAHKDLIDTEVADIEPRANIQSNANALSISGKFVSAAHSAAALDAGFTTVSHFLGQSVADKVKHELGFFEPTRRF